MTAMEYTVTFWQGEEAGIWKPVHRETAQRVIELAYSWVFNGCNRVAHIYPTGATHGIYIARPTDPKDIQAAIDRLTAWEWK